MLLAERLRRDEEKDEVRRVLERHCFGPGSSRTLDVDAMYYGEEGLPAQVGTRSCVFPLTCACEHVVPDRHN
jgi:hypothetical protein